MGLSASQGRLLLLTAKQSDLEFRAQQISQKRLVLAQQLEQISKEYEDATSNRVMSIAMYEEGTDDDGRKVQTTANLTYKNLISGTITDKNKAASAGLATGVYEVGASSNKAYRLVDTSGAIVVASKDEIPSEYTVTNTISKASEPKNNVYTVTNTKEDGSSATSYYAVATGALSNALAEYRKEKSSDQKEDKTIKPVLDYDSTNGFVRLTVNGTTKIYSLADGSEYTNNNKNFTQTNGEKITLVSSDQTSSIPNSTSISSKSTPTTLKEGGDECYSLYDSNGVLIQRYIVDSGLKYGTSGTTGDAADPNYLQDCLRNGKYLIEQYRINDDNTGSISWDKISWDATSNISDRYYTEDDAAAKAKYDRAQNEIQTADKKLELELDNVETQRNAVKTEIDSVKKVENENIEKSFNPFNA